MTIIRKPKIYWARCPDTGKGVWRVSQRVKKASFKEHKRWNFALSMASQMNTIERLAENDRSSNA